MSVKREMETLLSYPSEHTIRSKHFSGTGSQRVIPRRFSGWDPFEVWRTRVKAPLSGPTGSRELDNPLRLLERVG